MNLENLLKLIHWELLHIFILKMRKGIWDIKGNVDLLYRVHLQISLWKRIKVFWILKNSQNSCAIWICLLCKFFRTNNCLIYPTFFLICLYTWIDLSWVERKRMMKILKRIVKFYCRYLDGYTKIAIQHTWCS